MKLIGGKALHWCFPNKHHDSSVTLFHHFQLDFASFGQGPSVSP